MDLNQKAGVSASILLGTWDWPLHGLRHPPTPGTSGWYVWAGELADEEDFFQPCHLAHLIGLDPALPRLLEGVPGSRFLIAPGHEDVWHDASLIDL
ncbi:hypothetical protein [Microbacterium capsulatum]|uniref:Imm33-like domain-containing protein n=1 Tax=Microbacterium capsulatum TaxID=3041921 RepID=A0ABU0XIK5_9MICO|nr:hypothetical protein [Microbacterium sp. ASV81]MDQ4213960.1 hypothetical protein [Microbacterium sp. ASV81]